MNTEYAEIMRKIDQLTRAQQETNALLRQVLRNQEKTKRDQEQNEEIRTIIPHGYGDV